MVKLPLLDQGIHWDPTFTIKDILLGIQEVLDEPNTSDSVNDEANELYK